MKSTSCFLTACIVCGVLPLMVQGAELLDREGGRAPGTGPKAQRMYISPVVIEIESETINMLFTRDLGEVLIELQQTTGIPVFSQIVDTSVQNEMSLIVPTNTYILTLMTTDGTILIEETIVIP